MTEVADWLDAIGMAEYVERFAQNGIDLTVLPDLTDRDLEKLGVLLGHRRKMLRAIGELIAKRSNDLHSFAGARSREHAERRQLTVMFCDLVEFDDAVDAS